MKVLLLCEKRKPFCTAIVRYPWLDLSLFTKKWWNWKWHLTWIFTTYKKKCSNTKLNRNCSMWNDAFKQYMYLHRMMQSVMHKKSQTYLPVALYSIASTCCLFTIFLVKYFSTKTLTNLACFRAWNEGCFTATTSFKQLAPRRLECQTAVAWAY